MHRIDSFGAPLFVSWQLTRDCDLACVHCCTDSAPGKRLPDELDADEAMRLADDIARSGVPYVMLCGGEPLVVPHFFAVAEALGRAGVKLKIETNGQQFDASVAARLARLPIRSIQVSLDGDTQEVYGRQRAGGSLAKAHAACRAIRDAGLPLEITFAPTRINIHEAEAVIARAREFGAFRFNSGKLMRLGTAARHWGKLAPSEEQYREYRAVLARAARVLEPPLELCYVPWSIEDGLRAALRGTAGDVAGASERLGQGGGGASGHLRRPAAHEHRAGLAGVPGGLAQRSNESCTASRDRRRVVPRAGERAGSGCP